VHVNFRFETVALVLWEASGRVKHLRDHVKKEITRAVSLTNPSFTFRSIQLTASYKQDIGSQGSRRMDPADEDDRVARNV
jgi:hypothetical protein